MNSSPDLDHDQSPGRRRRRATFVWLGLVAAGAAALGGGFAASATGDRPAERAADREHRAAHGAEHRDGDRSRSGDARDAVDIEASPDDVGGLAGALASRLSGAGEVTDPTNWMPWGDQAPEGSPVLADGAFGYGGRVLLDGVEVSVVVHAKDDDEPCGYRVVEDGLSEQCRPFRGGHLFTNAGPGASGGTSGGALASFHADGAVVTVIALDAPKHNGAPIVEEPVLTLDELTELAVDPRFRTAPFN